MNYVSLQSLQISYIKCIYYYFDCIIINAKIKYSE